MKKLLGFMFGYGARGNGVLGWNTRLSQRDHLYHQGRNFLSMVIYSLFLMVVAIPVGLFGSAVSAVLLQSIPGWLGLLMVIVLGVIFLLPLLYLSFAALKLTILRLHDFGLSGWWIFYSIILGLMDFCFDSFFPGFSFFLSMQSLVYLGLLIWPSSPEANQYGEPAINSTATKPRWIRAVPLVLWVFSWLGGMLTPLAARQLEIAATETNQLTAEATLQHAEMERVLSNLNGAPTEPVTPVSPTSTIK